MLLFIKKLKNCYLELFVYYTLLLIAIMDTLLLKPECAELLKKIDKNPDEVVTCIFGDHIQFEQLDETKLLPLDLMRIVHDYYDDKMVIECSSCIVDSESFIVFNVSDNKNKIKYHYSTLSEMLCIIDENRFQQDDSILIMHTSFNYFNLSRLYYHYGRHNDVFFQTKKYKNGTVKISTDDKHEITYDIHKYISKILNHEILKRRIIVIRQLIDIIEKLPK